MINPTPTRPPAQHDFCTEWWTPWEAARAAGPPASPQLLLEPAADRPVEMVAEPAERRGDLGG